jgi:enoyl-CoA hydratase
MEFEILKTEKNNGIATVTISRPKAMNALNTRFFDEMDELIKALSSDQEIKVIILTGEGKAFVAGADIAEMVDMTQAQGSEFSKKGQNTFRSLELLEKPVIAAINGFALGGGCELALACDFRIASSKAKFGQPEVSLGLTPGYAGTQRLPRLIGSGNAMFMLLTGDMVKADEALRMGLVQKVVEPEDLLPTVQKMAESIITKGPKSVQLVKKLVREGLLTTFGEGCKLESTLFGSLFENEGAEGMKAFLEKRKPEWSK